MNWIKQLEEEIAGIPDQVSSNDVIRQALRILQKRPCYRPRDELYYNADVMGKKGSETGKAGSCSTIKFKIQEKMITEIMHHMHPRKTRCDRSGDHRRDTKSAYCAVIWRFGEYTPSAQSEPSPGTPSQVRRGEEDHQCLRKSIPRKGKCEYHNSFCGP